MKAYLAWLTPVMSMQLVPVLIKYLLPNVGAICALDSPEVMTPTYPVIAFMSALKAPKLPASDTPMCCGVLIMSL